MDIKCASAGLKPKAIVLVATIRALKYHGGASLKELETPDTNAVTAGLVNLEKHLENASLYNLDVVVAINRFTVDTDDEIAIVQERCAQLGVSAVIADVWGQGGKGATDLATVVAETIQSSTRTFEPLYDWGLSVRDKIEKICTNVYGADGVKYSSRAEADLRRIAKLELEGLPVCIAKTQKSFSDDPKKIGRPSNFQITVREIEIAAGAGFLVPITGDMMRMPGLPATPSSEGIDIDDDGNIAGLF